MLCPQGPTVADVHHDAPFPQRGQLSTGGTFERCQQSLELLPTYELSAKLEKVPGLTTASEPRRCVGWFVPSAAVRFPPTSHPHYVCFACSNSVRLINVRWVGGGARDDHVTMTNSVILGDYNMLLVCDTLHPPRSTRMASSIVHTFISSNNIVLSPNKSYNGYRH